MSSAEDSLAKISVSPALMVVLQGREAGYGANTLGLLAWLDRPTSSWKTSQRCLVEGWEPFSETWPRSGMRRNGTAYQLSTWAPLTVETESGSWPTPHGFSQDGRSNGPSGNELGNAVNRRMWPTPRAEDSEQTGGHRGKPDTLTAAARLWPTPTSQSAGLNGGAHSRQKLIAKVGENEAKRMSAGSLNPTWVEWLMGSPTEWTALKHWVTLSSRKSRKSSEGQ